MKRIGPFLLLLLALPFAVHGQVSTTDLGNEFGGRLGITLDRKIRKGFHASVDAELRMSDDFSRLGRVQAGAGVQYKLSDLFKLGGGYIFIEKKNSSSEWNARHRLYADVFLTLRYGDWRFSLKERLQMTHRDVGNHLQDTPNSLALKSRIKVSYKGFYDFTPYMYAELRNVFNDPCCTAAWSTVSGSFIRYSFAGYDDAYFNRLRGVAGVEWKLSRDHSFDFYVIGDYTYDKVIDTNKSGTRLKSLGYERGFRTEIGLGYQFSF